MTDLGSRVAAYVRQQWPKHAEKELQRAFDISEATAERILAGTVSKAVLEQMFKHFGWRFAQIVLQPLCGPGGALPVRHYPDHLWFTKSGLERAEQGHRHFVLEKLAIKDSGQQLTDFALRNLGFVQVTLHGDSLRIRYSEAGCSSVAIETLAAWLLGECRSVNSITRQVETAEGWVEHADPSLLDCANAIRRTLVKRTAPKASWSVERVPLATIKRLDFSELVIAKQTSGDPMPAAVGLKLFDHASVFNVSGSNVIPIWNGHALGIPKEFVGRNVLDRPKDDQAYGALVHRRIHEVLTDPEGCTFYKLSVDIAGRRRNYSALALRCAPDRVMTVADLSEEARCA